MNWEAVIANLRAQGDDAVIKSENLRKNPSNIPEVQVERVKTIERHRIQGNFCFGLADALAAGLGKK